MTSKKEKLTHLIGRPLVPFFVPGSNEENVNHLPYTLNQAPVEGTIEVRPWTNDGYFEKPERVMTSSALPNEARDKNHNNSNTNNNHNNKRNSNRKSSNPKRGGQVAAPEAPLVSKKRSSKEAPMAQHVVSVNGPRFAAPAHFNSPPPEHVPLPKFLRPVRKSLTEEITPSPSLPWVGVSETNEGGAAAAPLVYDTSVSPSSPFASSFAADSSPSLSGRLLSPFDLLVAATAAAAANAHFAAAAPSTSVPSAVSSPLLLIRASA